MSLERSLMNLLAKRQRRRDRAQVKQVKGLGSHHEKPTRLLNLRHQILQWKLSWKLKNNPMCLLLGRKNVAKGLPLQKTNPHLLFWIVMIVIMKMLLLMTTMMILSCINRLPQKLKKRNEVGNLLLKMPGFGRRRK